MPVPPLKVTKASITDDEAICRIARQSRYTRDFTSHRFFRDHIEDAYFGGEVGVAKIGHTVVGFVYCKHLKRRQASVVHFMGVDETRRGHGIGRALMDWALANQPHDCIELSCEHSNVAGMAFYPAIGYRKVRTGVYGEKNPRPYTRFVLYTPRIQHE